MALTEEQRRLLDRHLTLRAGEEGDEPTTTLTLTKRQFGLLIEAIDHFHATRCPLEGLGDGCELVTWREHPGGALTRFCAGSCTAWRDYLIEHVVPRAFPVPGARPAPVGGPS